MHDWKISSFIVAIGSAGATAVAAVVSLVLPGDKIVEWIVLSVAAGFLFFVRKWIHDQEEADRRLMDTLRKHIERQQRFEEYVLHFVGQVQGRLGLHSINSDPDMMGVPPQQIETQKGNAHEEN